MTVDWDKEMWQAVEIGESEVRAAREERDAARDAVCKGEWSDDEDDYFKLIDADRRLVHAEDKLGRAHVAHYRWIQATIATGREAS